MGIIQAARAAQKAARATHGVEVAYRRGDRVAWVTAVRAKTDVPVSSQYGALLVHRMRDWIIDSEDLCLDGEYVEPEAGDKVEVPVGDAAREYEVQEHPNGEVFRYSGPGRERFRIHTTHMGDVG